MNEYLIRAATEADLMEITELANQYVFEKLTAEERATGFLTGRFNVPAMAKMVASATSVVVEHNHQVIGFIINSKLPPEDYPPLLQAMVQKFPDLRFRNSPLAGYSYFFYGPVLISQSHRGKGLLPLMFRKTQELLQNTFELGIAFIHEQNLHSLKVHTEHLGLEVVGRFAFSSDNYFILVFSVTV